MAKLSQAKLAMNQLQLLIENNKKGLWKSGQKFTDHFPTGSAITIIVPTKQDICTLQKKGHFYFALTAVFNQNSAGLE